MDRLKRKYILPGSDKTEIPPRTKRWKKRKTLTEANDIEIRKSIQDLPNDSAEVWSPISGLSSQSLSGTTEEVDNLNHNSSDHDLDNGSEDAHDVSHTAITDEDSDAWPSLSGQQSLSGAEVSSLQADCDEFTPSYPTSPLLFEDESSTECDFHISDLQNLSPASESSNNLIPDNFDDSDGIGVFEPRQSFTDSDSESNLGSGEHISLEYEDSIDESHLGEAGNVKFPQVNEEPLYTGSRLTKAQSFLLILSFVLRHSLTGVALSDLLDLINIHCPENTVSASKHLFLKELKPIEGHLQCHIYCPNCEYYIGDQVSEGQCTVCNTTWDKNSSLKNGNFFIYLPIQTQLEHLLQRSDIENCLNSGKNTCNSENYEDICSGKMYHNLNEKGGPLDCPHGHSLILNCDGVPVFKSSLYSIWPLQGIVNELPYPVRKENVLLFGLWFGSKKPNVNTFLKPFTLECQKLSTVGFKLKRNGVLEQCRLVAALMMCDSVARPILQNMTQFNGQYGCSLCLHPGEQVQKGKGTVKAYPFKDVPKRDHASTISDAREALRTNTSVRGVKGPTCLINIPHFDIISGMPPDHMHTVHLGVVRQMASMWLDSENHEKPYYLGTKVTELDQRLLLIRPPCNVTRVPRSLQQRRFWKASEWQNWLLFYSIFVLKGILPQVFYQHWLILVTFMFLLCKDIITTEELKRCEKLVVDFVKQFETLYGKQNVSFNVHLCLHLPESVNNWGPLWAHSGYIFESFNGEILKLFHGTQCVPLQIMKEFTYRQVLPLLRNDALRNAVPACIQLYNHLTGQKRLKQFERVADQIVTLDLYYSRKLTSEEILAMREKLSVTADTIVKVFSRLLVNGQLYYSQEFTRVVKRNSFTVMLQNGHIITIYYYIIIEQQGTRKCIALGREYDRSHSTLINVEHVVGLKRLLRGRKQIFDVTMFKGKCMLIDLPQYASLYACLPPRCSGED
nr:uncharacterized protein LOC117467508 isoform X2 [Pseudochaenichthys georgianus]